VSPSTPESIRGHETLAQWEGHRVGDLGDQVGGRELGIGAGGGAARAVGAIDGLAQHLGPRVAIRLGLTEHLL